MKERAPRWWILYLMLLMLVGLFWLEATAAMTPMDHEAVQFGLVLAFFVAMAAWLHAENEAQIRQTMRDEAKANGYTYKLIIPDDSPAADCPRRETSGEDDNTGSVYTQLFNKPVMVTAPNDRKDL
jgi:hypothetical protein